MISIIIPAHNEEGVIAEGLRALTQNAGDDELEVIVVCNGCRDSTAAIARDFGPRVQVIESEIASKPHALNLGDRAATGFPRIYIDADVVLSLHAARQIADALERGPALAAAPAVETVFLDGAGASVRAYYEVRRSLAYMKEGMIGAGAYAVGREGRARFDTFPDVIADDGYFRLLFTPEERVEIAGAVCLIKAPTNLADLVRIRTRARLGVIQLREEYPELCRRGMAQKQYGSVLMSLLGRPRLYAGMLVYLWVTLLSRHRAKRQSRNLATYTWERDNSSRAHALEAKG